MASKERGARWDAVIRKGYPVAQRLVSRKQLCFPSLVPDENMPLEWFTIIVRYAVMIGTNFVKRKVCYKEKKSSSIKVESYLFILIN